MGRLRLDAVLKYKQFVPYNKKEQKSLSRMLKEL